MAEQHGSTRSPLRADLLGRTVVFASAGSSIGLVVALRESLLQGYAGEGFWHSIGLLLRGDTAVGAMAGALGFLAWLAVRENAVASFPRLGPALCGSSAIAFARDARWRLARAGLACSAGGLFLGVRTLEVGRPEPVAAAWAAGVALGIWLLLAATGLLARGRAPERLEALGVASTATLTFVLGGALLFADFAGRELLARDASATALAGASAGLVFWIVHAGFSTSHRGPARWLAPHLLPLAIGALLWLAGPLLFRPTLEAGNPRNVVLIGIDTLRFDRTSLAPPDERNLAGERRVRVTPELARLARRSILFRNAMSQASWTLPSFASLITGRYPQEHGAISLFGWLRPLELTLAEVLREAGYRTAAVVSHNLVDAPRGFAQGFDDFDASQVLGHDAVTSPEVTDAAIEWLGREDAEPFFLFVHYFDPHYEYRDHADWDFTEGYRGWILDEDPDIYTLRKQTGRIAADDLAYLRSLYDEEVALTDREIGRLLAALTARGLDDETAVVVVADHGEEFLERGWLGHTVSLYEGVLRVPLLLRLPGFGGGRTVDTPVETRALYATMLDYLRIDAADPGTAASLLPLARGGTAPAEPVFSSVWLPDAPAGSGKRVRRSAVRSGDWKLIRDHDSGDESLYSLSEDPGESQNLASSAPLRRAQLAEALDDWLERMGEADAAVPARDLSEEEKRRLEALGYL